MVDMKALSDYHSSDAAKRFLRKRHASESRFKFFGALAIAVAILALATLVWTIGSNAILGLKEYTAKIDVSLPAAAFNRETAVKPYERPLIEQGLMVEETIVRRVFRKDVSDALQASLFGTFGQVLEKDQEDTYNLLSGGNIDTLFQRVYDGELKGGDTVTSYEALLSDDAQLYFKGAFGELSFRQPSGILTPIGSEGEIKLSDAANDFVDALSMVKQALILRAERLEREAARQQNGVDVFEARLQDDSLEAETREELESQVTRFKAQKQRLADEAADLKQRAEQAGGDEILSPQLPSFFVFINDGVVKLTKLSNSEATGVVMRPLSSEAEANPSEWRLGVFETPEAGRKLSDVQLIYLESLKERDLISSNANFSFMSNGDSREAELAGVWGGLVGSFWTMLVTFSIAFPVGVMAAIYLEEFAPKNAFTDFIEVNINNLAAIPSIIFGLFGLLLLLSGFEIPIFGGVEIGGWFKEYRSAAFVGGIVLALMTLPTIIIAGRASVRAVPPSIRAAALGLGASKVQTTFHHVLPLAMPGIMTGTIIGMAQALGETAPLLMVGMVGFFAEVAGGVSDPTTVMPALVYFWSDYPENLFELKTSLAIVVLLLFLVAMNACAVFLRKRFERRW
ncbi:MAG: phosphate ABC transporter permease PstA [Rhodobacteraceae bacterium]|nr:phosphate ABC transporter permease PstA [Paracoccaceae bacterium]